MSSSIESAFRVLASVIGPDDEKITLRNLLLKRLKLLNSQPKDEISIDDLLLTHNMFLTSSFKPFVSTSSIYLKTLLPQINLGNYITIELDSCFNGDFVHDMYLDVTFDGIGDKDYIKDNTTNPSVLSNPNNTSEVRTSSGATGNIITTTIKDVNGATLQIIELKQTGTGTTTTRTNYSNNEMTSRTTAVTDFNNEIISTSTEFFNNEVVVIPPKFRYTPYPGIRLIEKVELWLNGRKVDEYSQEDVIFYMNNELENEKRKAFEKCVGQSYSKSSYSYSNDTEHDGIRSVADGYQTFKSYQEKLHMRIPLLFWFNKYMEKSYPVLKQDNVIISNSRNHIKITFADIDKIIQCGDYDEKSNPIIDDSNLVTPYFKTSTLKNYTVNNTSSPIKYPDLKMALYVNNIYVNDEVRTFYMNHIDHYMISTYQSLKYNVRYLNEIKVKDLHDMTPYLYFAFRTKKIENSFTEWYRFTYGTRKWHPIAVYFYFPTFDRGGNPVNGFIGTVKRSYYDTQHPIIKAFSLNFDTLEYIKHENPSDYNKYLSQLKKNNYSYSYDDGIYLLPFCSKFTDESVSGHINFSRISEIILKFDIDEELKNEDITLYISAKRINLLNINERDVNLSWSSYLL